MSPSMAVQLVLPLVLSYTVMVSSLSKRRPVTRTVVLAATNVLVFFAAMTYFAARLPPQLTWSAVLITLVAVLGSAIVDKPRSGSAR